MGEDPAAIRREIEQTRERMGETVDALGYKANIPSRAKNRVAGAFESAKTAVSGRASQVSDAAPSGEDVKHNATRAVGVAQENPLGLAIGAAAVGFLAGMLAPATKVEDEKLGTVADQVRDQAKQTGQEALERGKQVAQEAAETAVQGAKQVAAETKDKAQEATQQHTEELKSSAEERAEQVKESASQTT
jgi:gas vesicle protein